VPIQPRLPRPPCPPPHSKPHQRVDQRCEASAHHDGHRQVHHVASKDEVAEACSRGARVCRRWISKGSSTPEFNGDTCGHEQHPRRGRCMTSTSWTTPQLLAPPPPACGGSHCPARSPCPAPPSLAPAQTPPIHVYVVSPNLLAPRPTAFARVAHPWLQDMAGDPGERAGGAASAHRCVGAFKSCSAAAAAPASPRPPPQ
jgi:hypothetical protein